ncbi:hypothetical protein [Sphingomonas sp. MS122]|uniref:hypothetical protein n=1 Tax=Sphingomonas sp. MS122 TaxID=3412683 RepID=UPI003C2F14BF
MRMFGSVDRREVLTGLGCSGLILAGSPGRALAQPADRRRDWAWLEGNWRVEHRRLRRRLARDTHWDRFAGTSAMWLTLDGLGTIDDNLLHLPGGDYRAMGIRAYDPATGRWSIWWLDGRNPTRIDPPVLGRFEGETGTFTGADMFEGRPIDVRFHWQGIRGPRPHWQQSFSPDGGATWEMNWENFFTRTSAAPTPLPLLPRGDAARAPDDWGFLAGRWKVHHRKLRRRLAGSRDWDEFGGTFVNWPVLGGNGNVGDNLMQAPSGTFRGVGFRAWDPATREWLSWWLDGRDPSRIGQPLRGRFVDGIGTYLSDDVHEGRPVKTRVTWSRITGKTARWEQAFSADGGQSWEVNWTSDFTRIA